jgi:hypothetical protein
MLVVVNLWRKYVECELIQCCILLIKRVSQNSEVSLYQSKLVLTERNEKYNVENISTIELQRAISTNLIVEVN